MKYWYNGQGHKAMESWNKNKKSYFKYLFKTTLIINTFNGYLKLNNKYLVRLF